jgi:hypothetical protein
MREPGQQGEVLKIVKKNQKIKGETCFRTETEMKASNREITTLGMKLSMSSNKERGETNCERRRTEQQRTRRL